MPFITANFQNLIKLAFNNQNGNASSFSGQFISALTAATASCLVNMGASPIPFVPSGSAATQNLISMVCQNTNGNTNATAQQIATAVSVFNPLIPPVMLSVLQAQLVSVLANQNGSADSAASQIANAINAYYSGSGLIM